MPTAEVEKLAHLLELVRRIRRDCPWDREQTLQSLRPYTLEEVHELADAILDDDNAAMRKELGDMLMHIFFYAVIAEEEHRFDMSQVLDAISEKIVYRHPHVFGDVTVADAREVEQRWEALKLKEKDGNRRVLQGVPRSLPPLTKALRIQEKASAVGFDWKDGEGVWPKVMEEIGELREAIDENPQGAHAQEELGDALFALVNLARFLRIDPVVALEQSNQKFMRRFNHVESRALEQGRSLPEMTLQEMDVYWDEAKELERRARGAE